jgi:hypothetical protein
MKFGQCGLCLQTGQLQKSHFLPAALWRAASDPRFKNPNPVAMTKTVSKTTSDQIQAYLLCSDCETRFNKNGEHYVLRWLAPSKVKVGQFPLLKRLNVALERSRDPTFKLYSSVDVGVDTGQFAYFALSILWRAAVHSWRLPDGKLREKLSLGQYEEPIRGYLLTGAPFPENVVVVLTVCTDSESRGIMYPPTESNDASIQRYGFLAFGVHFDVLTGTDIPSGWRECCCVNSQIKPIYSRNCYDRTFRAFSYLASTRKPVEKLLRR